jgi:hypothetical protein
MNPDSLHHHLASPRSFQIAVALAVSISVTQGMQRSFPADQSVPLKKFSQDGHLYKL